MEIIKKRKYEYALADGREYIVKQRWAYDGLPVFGQQYPQALAPQSSLRRPVAKGELPVAYTDTGWGVFDLYQSEAPPPRYELVLTFAVDAADDEDASNLANLAFGALAEAGIPAGNEYNVETRRVS